MNKRKIVIVLGPTASGKSSLALELAKKHNGILISADSRQVYQGMNIGTNKDHGDWINGVFYVDGIPEYLIDVAKPDESFTLDDWVKMVEDVIADNPDKLPIIVGGTGLYISALVNNYDIPEIVDKIFRGKLEKLIDKKGLSALVEKIKAVDTKLEQKIDIQNPRRVIRAAEIVLKTKKPLMQKKGESKYDVVQLGRAVEKDVLYERIDRRVEEMVTEGLVDEVKGLMRKGYLPELPSMTGIGYRQVCQFVNNEISGQEAIRLIQRDTRRYAKRQMTWFRRDKNIKWVENLQQAEKELK
jgi:tRNA dimethylallyltransferase